MYRFFNEKLEAGLPTDVVFTLIPNRGRSHYLGWLAPNRWETGTERFHEVNLTADHLNRDVDGIAETMIHEIVHLKNNIEGIKDCSVTQYHTRAFKTVAESFGLKVERMKNKGYALTSLGDDARKLVNTYKADILKGANPFVIHRVPEIKISKPNPKKSVQIDASVAETILTANGGKLSHNVDTILREWITNNG